MALFLLSLITPAYHTVHYGRSQVHFGFEALLLGPIGLFAGHFSWLGNLFLIGAWLSRPRAGVSPTSVLALVGAAFAMTFMAGGAIAVGNAGDFAYRAGVGYYLWLASFVPAAAAGLMSASEKEGEASAS